MSTLTIEDGMLLLRTPFDAALVARLKADIPPNARAWDKARHAWRIDPRYRDQVVRLVHDVRGENLTVPTGTLSVPVTEIRMLDVRYIGSCKVRGGESVAYGWSEGRWRVIFPERVLRAWFNSEARPNEAPTLYATLTVTWDATAAEIKTAYRRLAMQWHPDRCKEPGATEQFQAIQHAYEILNDPIMRAKYDAGLKLIYDDTAIKKKTFIPSHSGYRSPLRCGYLIAEGISSLEYFVVSKIIEWVDITDAQGRVLVTSWPMGADTPMEVWQ